MAQNTPILGQALDAIRDQQTHDHERHEWIIYRDDRDRRFGTGMTWEDCKLLLEKIATFLNGYPEHFGPHSRKPRIIAPR